jgi:hypothetical protein
LSVEQVPADEVDLIGTPGQPRQVLVAQASMEADNRAASDLLGWAEKAASVRVDQELDRDQVWARLLAVAAVARTPDWAEDPTSVEQQAPALELGPSTGLHLSVPTGPISKPGREFARLEEASGLVPPRDRNRWYQPPVSHPSD